MIKLIESDLFGHNLIEVSNPALVKRYNDCLNDIGLAPTLLKKFHIDGWGWSPEIATEQGDRFYLSHGLANPYGIVISPKQSTSALYMPFHSFDRQIHESIFRHYNDQIVDITSRSGLWFELDQEISAYRSPQDLLMVDYVKVNFSSVDRLMVAAKDQRALIRDFYDKPQAWSNDKLRQDIIDSCQKYGDLRYVKFDIPSHPFTDIDTFYTAAFKGLYVFKRLKNDKPLLVYEGAQTEVSGETKHGHVEYNMKDPSLISYLYNAGLISSDATLYQNNPELVKVMQEHVVMLALSDQKEEIQYSSLNKNQKKGLVNRLAHEGLLPEVYFDFERFYAKLKEGSPIGSSDISEAIRPYLLNPSKDLDGQDKAVLWQLLANFNDANPVLLYLFDKSKFYSKYQTWNEELQVWVIKKILEHKNIYNHLI
ncbi:MAG: hypothetical protein ACI9JN_001110 [Bacteroidia bacterium]|jgi:hypothetical protein